MRISTINQLTLARPRFGPWRAPLGMAAVVILLSALFAGAILAALQPHPPADVGQASLQGGL